MNSKIEQWFNGDQNYQQGLALLIEAGFTKGKVLKNLHRGESKSTKEKLAWELCEIAKLDRSIVSQVNTNVTDQRVSIASGKKGSTGKSNNGPIEPPIITAIKKKLAEIGNLRGQVHNEVRMDIRNADARLYETSFNRQVIAQLVALNAPAANGLRPPRLVLDTGEGEDLQVYAENLPKLTKTGLRIGAHHVVKTAHGDRGNGIEGRLNDAGNGGKTDGAGQECLHCHFVGSVEQGRGTALLRQSPIG